MPNIDLEGRPVVNVDTEIPPTLCESNTFATHPDGFSVHYKLVAEFAQLIAMTEGLVQHLKDFNYVPGQPQGRGGPPKQGGKPQSKADGPPCEFCDSPSYQNTSKAGKPYLKCSNKSCNAIAPYRDRETNEWVWKEDSPRD